MHYRSALGSNQLWSHLSCLKTSHVALCLFQTITKSYPPLTVKDLLIIQVVSRADLAFNQCGVEAWQTFSCQNYLWLLGRGLPAQEHSAITSYDTHLNPQCTLPWGVAFSFVYCKISCTHNLYVDLLYFSGLPQCHSDIWGLLKCDLQDCALFVSVLPHFWISQTNIILTSLG